MTYSLASRSLESLIALRSLAYTHLAPQLQPRGDDFDQVLEDLLSLLSPAGLQKLLDRLSPTERSLLQASLDPQRAAALAPAELSRLGDDSHSLLRLLLNSRGQLAAEFHPQLVALLESPAAKLQSSGESARMHYVDVAEVIDCGSVQLADTLADHPVLASLCLRAGAQCLVVLHREMASFRLQLQKLGYGLPVIRG